MDHQHDAKQEQQNSAPTPARFPIERQFPAAAAIHLPAVQKAIRRDYVDASKWKQLNCTNVSLFAEHKRGTVFVIQVGQSVEFDWSWEGATAFQPVKSAQTEFLGAIDADGHFDHTHPTSQKEQAANNALRWSGEIVEVDSQNGCLFVHCADILRPPSTGTFFVRPFEFLAVLDSIYNDQHFAAVRSQLSGPLSATLGGVHPVVAASRSDNAEAQIQGRAIWNHAWSVLWGPPGTGKTYTTGQQIAQTIASKSTDANVPQERILIVSTTNRATDTVATSIGRAAQKYCPVQLNSQQLVRIGKGGAMKPYVEDQLEVMLSGNNSLESKQTLAEIETLREQLAQHQTWEDRALTRKQINELRQSKVDASASLFLDRSVDVVVATAFKAISLLNTGSVREMLESGYAPFTTIFIDESGQISRATAAALSLLASRRVVLVGDSKQLAPISKMARLLPSVQARWLAKSAISHLDDMHSIPSAVTVLREQRRMHPEICRVVSDYQYDGELTTALDTVNRPDVLPANLQGQPRAIWYVLDEEDPALSTIRAARGPGNRSWVRQITPKVLKKILSLFDSPNAESFTGLFISPYKAQAHMVALLLAEWQLKNWESSTVHSQQGHEADLVIFDTVNAGSNGWPYDEWKRLVNVAISRARQAVIVLASRSEMDEPHLRNLKKHLRRRVLRLDAGELHWQEVAEVEVNSPKPQSKTVMLAREDSLGYQIQSRKEMRPILSQEQQQLSNLQLDGKPRLVRGVAGSGKSVVLSNWLARTVKQISPNAGKVWAVYANKSLHKLLRQTIESAWKQDKPLLEFPWEQVDLYHIQEILTRLLPRVELSMATFAFDYDKAAEAFLAADDMTTLPDGCSALFIDEAQDMGPHTLRLLLSMVQQTDEADHNSRSAHIFYDNAQNIYGRPTPKWSEFGLDMRGRSSIMKESFRSTNEISAAAVNALHRLSGQRKSADIKEMLSLGLLEETTRAGQPWLAVNFNQVSGPAPTFEKCETIQDELNSIGRHLEDLICNEDVAPEDICLIYNGPVAKEQLLEQLQPRMAKLDVELSHQTSSSYDLHRNTLLLTTPHSFKGYEAEVVIIPFVDCYIAEGQVLSNPLYVAMTRARSILSIYALDREDRIAKELNTVLEFCCGVK